MHGHQLFDRVGSLRLHAPNGDAVLLLKRWENAFAHRPPLELAEAHHDGQLSGTGSLSHQQQASKPHQ